MGCLLDEEWHTSLEHELVVIHFASSVMCTFLMKLGSLSLKNGVSKEYGLSNFRYGRAIKNILAMDSLEVQGHGLTLGGVLYHLFFSKERNDLVFKFSLSLREGKI